MLLIVHRSFLLKMREKKLKAWTKFEKIILVLSVVCFLSMCGVYAVGGGSSGQPWRVEVERTESQQQEVPDSGRQEPDSLREGELIHLNSASVSDLARLPGVGPVRAQAIEDYRQEHGPFTAVDDLTAVKGIGPAIVEGLRPYVTVE